MCLASRVEAAWADLVLPIDRVLCSLHVRLRIPEAEVAVELFNPQVA